MVSDLVGRADVNERDDMGGRAQTQQLRGLATDTAAMALADLPQSTVDPDAGIICARVFTRLAQELPRRVQDAGWTVRLVQGPEPDGWALGDGLFVITDRLLHVAKTEAGLAALVAHLMFHVAEGHASDPLESMLRVPRLMTPAELAGDHTEYGPMIANAGYDPAAAPAA